MGYLKYYAGGSEAALVMERSMLRMVDVVVAEEGGKSLLGRQGVGWLKLYTAQTLFP